MPEQSGILPYNGAVVVCRFTGSGRVWPEGDHVRSGRILKSAPAGGWLVRIFSPIPERDRMTDTWEDRWVITCTRREMEIIG